MSITKTPVVSCIAVCIAALLCIPVQELEKKSRPISGGGTLREGAYTTVLRLIFHVSAGAAAVVVRA